MILCKRVLWKPYQVFTSLNKCNEHLIFTLAQSNTYVKGIIVIPKYNIQVKCIAITDSTMSFYIFVSCKCQIYINDPFYGNSDFTFHIAFPYLSKEKLGDNLSTSVRTLPRIRSNSQACSPVNHTMSGLSLVWKSSSTMRNNSGLRNYLDYTVSSWSTVDKTKDVVLPVSGEIVGNKVDVLSPYYPCYMPDGGYSFKCKIEGSR